MFPRYSALLTTQHPYYERRNVTSFILVPCTAGVRSITEILRNKLHTVLCRHAELYGDSWWRSEPALYLQRVHRYAMLLYQ